MVHSICPDPINPQRVFVGISAAGVFRTDDGGNTWARRIKACAPISYPINSPRSVSAFITWSSHPKGSQHSYQQNRYCGVMTEDAGETWTDISEGLPSRFGFPIVVSPATLTRSS